MPVLTEKNLQITIEGAAEHNLKGVSVNIPWQKLTVITGVSGSGKSSLAFQTLFAEGQRRYLRTLPGRVHEWLSFQPRPRVDRVTGLPPVVAVRQERPLPSSRSTVATVAEVSDYLRLLYARLGMVSCPDCQIVLASQTPQEIMTRLLDAETGSKLLLLAPIVHQKTGTHRAELERIHKEGFVRIRCDGEIIELSDLPELNPEIPHTIETVVDRLIIKSGIESRLYDSLLQSLRVGNGQCLALLDSAQGWIEHYFSTELCCPACSRNFRPVQPQQFSWQSAQGACPACEGSGRLPCSAVSRKRKPLSRPGRHSHSKTETTISITDQYRNCSECSGERLNLLSRSVRFSGLRFPELLARPVTQACEWLNGLDLSHFDPQQAGLAAQLLQPVKQRLQCLQEIGLGYLSLDRLTENLSAGELQRVRLARCLGTELNGSCYILDEPAAGLHEVDIDRLLAVLQALLRHGNTVVCVEHHPRIIRAADHLIELGPGGGKRGGSKIFEGNLAEIFAEQTPTAVAIKQYDQCLTDRKNEKLSNRNVQQQNPISSTIVAVSAEKPQLRLKNASLHHLQNCDLTLPLQKMVTVSGVSGSGKSSLILGCLAPLLKQALAADAKVSAAEQLGELQIQGNLRRIEVVDQSPPGKSSHSCPATYSGLWKEIRRLLCRTRLARLRGLTPKHFRLQSGEGTCSVCHGRGLVHWKVGFLADDWIVCPQCDGERFAPEILEIRFQGKSAGDLLKMTIDESLEFWANMSSIVNLLTPLQQLGIGYLTLGQSANTLSGGEAQRLKLARFLVAPAPDTLLILDEPTNGLHWQDVHQLFQVLRQLQANGMSIVVIEHHDLFRTRADWRIELGPGAGAAGGQIQSSGPI